MVWPSPQGILAKRSVRGFFDQVLGGGQVGTEFLNAGVPGGCAGRGGGFRPVVIRPFRGAVFWVAAEFEDVPLREAEVFEKHPEGVRDSRQVSCRGDWQEGWQ